MLIINNLAFAKNDKEFTNALFKPINGKTCFGFYKVLKHRVLLMDMHKNIFAAIYKNGIVNAIRMDDGKIFHQYGLSDNIMQKLGVPESYMASVKYSEKLFNEAHHA